MSEQPVYFVAKREIEQTLFEIRKKIYPRALTGWFAAWRWSMVWFTQLLFYGGAWLTWHDRQAILFDLVSRKFYLFGWVLWPQDFIYLAILLIISALSLFLFTAIAGRLFCGYACPQTVYTEIFMWVERKVEGDRTARMRLDQAPFSIEKGVRKSIKHSIWLLVAFWTGITFVGYFTPIRVLIQELGHLSTGPWETFWIFFYGFATYGNAGWMREQVCKYMCPYARFQSAMFDKDTLTITYDAERGEPRGSRSKKADYSALGLGACVDCTLCVQVCPTGIDIRNGLQYECIGCAACIDACNHVMDKMGYARGLIRYTTERSLLEHLGRSGVWRRVLRPRVWIYLGVLAVIVSLTMTSLALRIPLKVDVIRDRGIPRTTERGEIENVYRLQIMNMDEITHRYLVSVVGIKDVQIISESISEVGGVSNKMIPVRVRAPMEGMSIGSNKIEFVVKNLDQPTVQVREKAAFLVPR